jgi:hypothetical protein
MIIFDEKIGAPVFLGDTFRIVMHRYSDPNRLNMARNAAIYLGKSDRDNIRRPLSVIKAGHVPEVLRGEYAEFEFIDVSKTEYDHLITYTTRNMRVAGGNRALTSDDYTVPGDKMFDPELVEVMIGQSMDSYKFLLESKERPQVARAAMPVGAKMNPFVYQFNFVTLTHIFTQRLWELGAQANTVKVVEVMWQLVRSVDQELWDAVHEAAGPHVKEWKDVQKKLRKTGLKMSDLYTHLSDAYGCGDYAMLEMTLEEYLRSVWQTKIHVVM